MRHIMRHICKKTLTNYTHHQRNVIRQSLRHICLQAEHVASLSTLLSLSFVDYTEWPKNENTALYDSMIVMVVSRAVFEGPGGFDPPQEVAKPPPRKFYRTSFGGRL